MKDFVKLLKDAYHIAFVMLLTLIVFANLVAPTILALINSSWWLLLYLVEPTLFAILIYVVKRL